MIRSSLIEAWDTRCAKIALYSVSKRTRILLGIVAVYIGAVAFLLYRISLDIDPRYRESGRGIAGRHRQCAGDAARATGVQRRDPDR